MTAPHRLTHLLAATLLMAALSACDDKIITPLPGPDAPEAPQAIEGQVTNWMQQEGAFVLTDLATGTKTLATAEIAEGGHFVAPLTTDAATLTDAAMTPQNWMLNTGCSGTLSSTNPAARVAVGVRATAQIPGEVRPVVASEVARVPGEHTTLIGHWVHASEATQLTGELDCASTLGYAIETPTSVEVDLLPGWNLVGQQITLKLGLKGLSAAGTINATGRLPGTWVRLSEVRSRAMP